MINRSSLLRADSICYGYTVGKDGNVYWYINGLRSSRNVVPSTILEHVEGTLQYQLDCLYCQYFKLIHILIRELLSAIGL